MEIGFDFRTAMGTALDAARDVEAVAAQASRRAERAFEVARTGGGDVQGAAERFRAAHRAHVEARAEVAEVEAEGALAA